MLLWNRQKIHASAIYCRFFLRGSDSLDVDNQGQIDSWCPELWLCGTQRGSFDGNPMCPGCFIPERIEKGIGNFMTRTTKPESLRARTFEAMNRGGGQIF